jgi:DNA-binding XRE family transcriptional regulator
MYTTDLELLNSYIKESGLKRDYLGKALGLSRASFIYRMRGKRDFTITEVYKLSIVLHLTESDIMKIFFAKRVSKINVYTTV